MSKEEIKSLWDRVKIANLTVDNAEKQLEQAIASRSAVLQEIAENSGKGPFQVNGLGLVTIRSRGKKDGSGHTYFLVGKSASDVTVID